MTALGLAKLGLKARRAFRAWREYKRGKKMLKGKLTYSAFAAGLILPIAQAFGLDIAPAEIDAVLAAVAALVGVYGRWRATRS